MYTVADIEKVKNILLRNIPDPQYIFLFGSYAAGKEKKDSDLDMAIITKNEITRKKKLALLNKLWNETGDNGYVVDFIIKSLTDFETEKKLPTLSNIINSSGKLLWQKN